MKLILLSWADAIAQQEDEFYDALDSLDLMDEDPTEEVITKKGEDPKIKELRDKLGRINRKKAKIRSRKV